MVKKILIVIAIIIIVFISFVSYMFYYDSIHKIDGKELIAYLHLRLVETELAIDGNVSEDFTSDEMKLLENIAKRINSRIDWFSDNNGMFYVDTADTSDYEITCISNGKYCVTFYAKDQGLSRLLVKCTFSKENEKGYKFWVE